MGFQSSNSRKNGSEDGRGGSSASIQDPDEEFGGEGRALLDYSPEKPPSAGLSGSGGSGGKSRHR
jgi:hypothetical protein